MATPRHDRAGILQGSYRQGSMAPVVGSELHFHSPRGPSARTRGSTWLPEV